MTKWKKGCNMVQQLSKSNDEFGRYVFSKSITDFWVFLWLSHTTLYSDMCVLVQSQEQERQSVKQNCTKRDMMISHQLLLIA